RQPGHREVRQQGPSRPSRPAARGRHDRRGPVPHRRPRGRLSVLLRTAARHGRRGGPRPRAAPDEMRAALLAPLLLLSCASEPPPAQVDEARFWLEACATHDYTQAETAMATGKEAREVATLQARYGIKPLKAPAGKLLLLPYPGGRHPRIGFL